MNFKFKIDQRQALLRGINAPSSTAKLDVDPVQLDEHEREVLAALMVEGYDCTQRALDFCADDLRGTGYSDSSTAYLVLYGPTIDDLRPAIARLLQQRTEWRRADAIKQTRRRSDADQRIRDALANPVTEEHYYVWNDVAERPEASLFGGRKYGVTLACSHPRYIHQTTLGDASPDMQTAYQRARDELSAQHRANVEAAIPELRRMWEEQEQLKAAAVAARQALYDRLPAPLRLRSEAGYAQVGEVEDAMRQLAVDDAGLIYTKWADFEQLTRLTDEQFAALRAAEKRAPEGATVTPARVWDISYRPADEDDEPEDIDEDGDVEVRQNERVIAMIQWHVGTLRVTAGVPL